MGAAWSRELGCPLYLEDEGIPLAETISPETEGDFRMRANSPDTSQKSPTRLQVQTMDELGQKS